MAFSFTGQREDAYVNLTEMEARWYDPVIGRWISPDSIIPEAGNLQALNRFSYVLGNPLRYNDPTGHQENEPEPGTKEWYERYFTNYGIVFTGADWGIDEYKIVFEAIQRVDAALRANGYDPKAVLGIGGERKLTFERVKGSLSSRQLSEDTIRLNFGPVGYYDVEKGIETTIHEIGHLIDDRALPGPGHYSWAPGAWRAATGWWQVVEPVRRWVQTEAGWKGMPTTNAQQRGNPLEDFADTFALFVELHPVNSGGYRHRAGWPDDSQARTRLKTLGTVLSKFPLIIAQP